jgi:glycosyltransferase involved in cell wall biosynthesis
MQISPLLPAISIIIPVYNRANLLPETLNSIMVQTFTDWECILVDDHSTDDSYAVMEEYQNKDPRIKAYSRPLEFKKGANACRNYGFSKSTASHIKWFDSDDIMLPNHLEIAYKTLVDKHLGFVVTDSLNFDHDSNEFLGKTYNFDRDKAIITAENFALMRIGWITDDFLGTRELVEKLKFNEDITTDGDEYNFFVRLIHHSVNGALVNMVLTHRRIHNETLTGQNGEDTVNYFKKVANVKYQTAQDLIVYNNKNLIRWFLSGYMRYSFDLANQNKPVPYMGSAFKLICKYYSLTKGGAFLLALLLGSYFNKGYNIMKYARK